MGALGKRSKSEKLSPERQVKENRRRVFRVDGDHISEEDPVFQRSFIMLLKYDLCKSCIPEDWLNDTLKILFCFVLFRN